MSAYDELQMGHVFDGHASIPKKSCFRAWSHMLFIVYLGWWGLSRSHFDNIMSISSFSSHLCSGVFDLL